MGLTYEYLTRFLSSNLIVETFNERCFIDKASYRSINRYLIRIFPKNGQKLKKY